VQAGRWPSQCRLGSAAARRACLSTSIGFGLQSYLPSRVHLPELATAHEQGLADFEANAWSGLFLPKGTPAAIVSKLNLAASEAMDTKSVQDRMHELGTTLVSADRRSPEYLQMLVEREIAKWGPLIKAAGISAD
jgi:putative tricarboxylic transport membrane protein